MRWWLALAIVFLSFAPTAFAMGDRLSSSEDHAQSGCIVGGCSGQLCSEATAEPMMSTCEFRASYACYGKHSSCQRQPNGQCGWTPNAALAECLVQGQAAIR